MATVAHALVHGKPFTPPPDPTPAEIAAACREIQAEWSHKERLKRSGKGDRVEERKVYRTPSLRRPPK